MQNLIEDSLKGLDVAAEPAKVVYLSKPAKSKARLSLEEAMARRMTKKDARKMMKEERHASLMALLIDGDCCWTDEAVLVVIELIGQRLVALRDNSIDHTAYEAFQETQQPEPMSSAVSQAVKFLAIKGKGQKQYARSVIALLFTAVMKARLASKQARDHVHKLSLEDALQVSSLLTGIWEAIGSNLTAWEVHGPLGETASLYLSRMRADRDANNEQLGLIEGISGHVDRLEAIIEESLACSTLIDSVVNCCGHDNRLKPIGQYKMKF